MCTVYSSEFSAALRFLQGNRLSLCCFFSCRRHFSFLLTRPTARPVVLQRSQTVVVKKAGELPCGCVDDRHRSCLGLDVGTEKDSGKCLLAFHRCSDKGQRCSMTSPPGLLVSIRKNIFVDLLHE